MRELFKAEEKNRAETGRGNAQYKSLIRTELHGYANTPKQCFDDADENIAPLFRVDSAPTPPKGACSQIRWKRYAWQSVETCPLVIHYSLSRGEKRARGPRRQPHRESSGHRDMSEGDALSQQSAEGLPAHGPVHAGESKSTHRLCLLIQSVCA